MGQVLKKFILVLMGLMLSGWPINLCHGESGPDTVELGTLAQLYDPVIFDHTSHVDLADGNCSQCHHHTTGTAPIDPKCLKCHSGDQEADSLACQECHTNNRFEASYLAEIAADSYLYHTDKPGLKGAYHQNCMGCHQKMDGPTGCQDCHERNEKGDEFFRSGKFAPDSADADSGH